MADDPASRHDDPPDRTDGPSADSRPDDRASSRQINAPRLNSPRSDEHVLYDVSQVYIPGWRDVRPGLLHHATVASSDSPDSVLLHDDDDPVFISRATMEQCVLASYDLSCVMQQPSNPLGPRPFNTGPVYPRPSDRNVERCISLLKSPRGDVVALCILSTSMVLGDTGWDLDPYSMIESEGRHFPRSHGCHIAPHALQAAISQRLLFVEVQGYDRCYRLAMVWACPRTPSVQSAANSA